MTVVAVLGATASAQTLAAPAQQRQAPDNAALVYPSTYSEHWIEDVEFLHGPALLDFDLRKYLADAAPHLLPHAEYLSHWCGYYSISPKLLLAIIEMRSGLVLASGTPAALADPLRGLVPGTDFQTQIQNALAALYTDFYAFREAASRPAADPTSLNAATYALLNLFRGTAEPASFVAVAAPTQTNLIATYRKLFPGLAKPVEPSIAAVPPAGLLQLPWKVGASWYFGGVHTTTGADPGVMSSLDVYRTPTSWGANTSNEFVVATLAGTVQVFSSCGLRVTSPSGWATNYYHISNLTVITGSQVVPNQTLGVYANTLAQATCSGGSASGPHLHFSLLKDGAFAPLDGVNLSGFVVHSGRHSYDTDPAFMWLEKHGVHYAAFSARVPSSFAVGPFTDPTITGGIYIKTVHVSELRTRIDNARTARGLPAFSWTTPTLGATVTAVMAVHFMEMRTALAQLYAAAGVALPAFSDATLSGVAVKAAHLMELRAAVSAVE